MKLSVMLPLLLAALLGTSSLARAQSAPAAPTPPITSSAKLIQDFQSVVTGVGQNGCGLEAQLESWYHFLVAPDPWASITIDGSNVAHYTGVDGTVLKQRHDFLRPDSLVGVIMLTDEDDSFADPLALGGQGYSFSSSSFPASSQQRSGGTGTTAPWLTWRRDIDRSRA